MSRLFDFQAEFENLEFLSYDRYQEKIHEYHNTKCKTPEVDIEDCEHCEYDSEEGMPMFNYGQVLYDIPSEAELDEVADKTRCCIVHDPDEGKSYICLMACGMDYTQDIALAYLICDGHIPDELAPKVSLQPGLTQSGANFERILRGLEKTSQRMENAGKRLRYDLDRIRQEVKA